MIHLHSNQNFSIVEKMKVEAHRDPKLFCFFVFKKHVLDIDYFRLTNLGRFPFMSKKSVFFGIIFVNWVTF